MWLAEIDDSTTFSELSDLKF